MFPNVWSVSVWIACLARGSQQCERSCLGSANIAHLEVYVCVLLTESEAWNVCLQQLS